MELWIRSQDRENTVKINRQYGLHWKDKTMIIADYQPDFVGTEGEYYELLGKYKSEERALEVLDEIRNILYRISYPDLKNVIDVSKLYIPPIIIYEMPQE